MGKHKPIYDPSTDCGDYVVAAGCHDLKTTGKKRFQKKYYTHTTRPGSLKSMTMDQMFARWGGGEVLRRAVKGMLPKNRLQEPRLARLKSEFTSSVSSVTRVCDSMPLACFGDLWANHIAQLSRVLPILTRRISSSSGTSQSWGICLKCKMSSRRRRPNHQHSL